MTDAEIKATALKGLIKYVDALVHTPTSALLIHQATAIASVYSPDEWPNPDDPEVQKLMNYAGDIWQEILLFLQAKQNQA